MLREISWLILFFFVGYAACQGGIVGDTFANADSNDPTGGSSDLGANVADSAEDASGLLHETAPMSDAMELGGSSAITGEEVTDLKVTGRLIDQIGAVSDAGIPGDVGSSFQKITSSSGEGTGFLSPESGNIVGILQVLTEFHGKGGSKASTAQESTSNTQASNGVSSFTKEVSPYVSSIVKSIKKLLNAMQMSGLKAFLEFLNKIVSAARNKASIEKTLEDKIQKPVKDIVNIILGQNQKLRVLVIIDVIAFFLKAMLNIVIRFG